MTRFGREGKVYFIEEPVWTDIEVSEVRTSPRDGNIEVCVPTIRHGDDVSPDDLVRQFVAKLPPVAEKEPYIVWFYTPMMLPLASDLQPAVVIYDCMDELANFKNPPEGLMDREKELFQAADIVFTGGRSLYEAKRLQHPEVHAFPSSIDTSHFSKARDLRGDGSSSERPKAGFIGVIDERFDPELLEGVAVARPQYDFVIVGPVVKIDPEVLPKQDNIEYAGQKSYDELPQIMADWDVAIMPFAINDATRFISPTKTPEYLAAGLPVVSTPITDVVTPYGDEKLVYIASTADEFADALDQALEADRADLLRRADEFLSVRSWDKTFGEMRELIDQAAEKRRGGSAASAS